MMLAVLLSVLYLSITLIVRSSSMEILQSNGLDSNNRTFIVDWENNRFLKDGKPFRFIAGSFHYFRSHPGSWQRKLRSMRAAGLNVVTTYVEWSLHNPKDGQYVWDGIADLEKFIRLAIAEDLLVILRPGPYICAERDMGGFPYWLLNKYHDIQLRTTDKNYLKEVSIWYNQLMPRMTPYLYVNGGPIIMVQVENEYGSFGCDTEYPRWLKNETHYHVKDKAVLFTNDGVNEFKCGRIPGILTTLDFGIYDKPWNKLREVQPKGPLVNAEFYPGWLTHWGDKRMARVPTDKIIQAFIDMLNEGASVNFYMFYGGTDFGFTAGANGNRWKMYQVDTTSYDYDAPLDESGDPTEKYYKIREAIGRYLPLPNIPIPVPLPKKHYGTIRLTGTCSILSNDGRQMLSTGTVTNVKPLTFETLGQNSGFVLYETDLPNEGKNPILLEAIGTRDFGYVYIDGKYVNSLSREAKSYSFEIKGGLGKKLQILVENQGRINYGITNDFKGFITDVLANGTALDNWTMTQYPMESYKDILSLIYAKSQQNPDGKVDLRNGPVIFYGSLIIKDKELFDTYFDPTGWFKGSLFVNGVNLGRYRPTLGPQITLYVPKEVLKTGLNEIVIMEHYYAPQSREVTFTNVQRLDG